MFVLKSYFRVDCCIYVYRYRLGPLSNLLMKLAIDESIEGS
jgi:hypothetical protein